MASSVRTATTQLGIALRDARERAGISIPEAAARIGWSESRLESLEQGRGQLFFTEALRVLDVYGLSVDEFGDEVRRPLRLDGPS